MMLYLWGGGRALLNQVSLDCSIPTFTTIHCKFYANDAKVSKADIDPFCNATDKEFFTSRYTIATNQNWANDVAKICQTQVETEANATKVNKTTPKNESTFLSQQNGEALTALLDQMEQISPTQRDKGTRFERLSIDYLPKDKKFQVAFTRAQTYADWTKEYLNLAKDIQDVGIDLVATNSNTYNDVVSIGGGVEPF